jgi:hypothetical protein
VLALAFGVLAGAGGYWAVIRSRELSARRTTRPSSPPPAGARGDIIDRDGTF